MQKPSKSMNPRKGFLIVSAIWVSACVIGAVPFMISGTFDNFIDAFFEASSGFTTTGATVIDDIGSCPKPILFWRCLTHWLGGMGIVVFFAALIPMWGIRGQIAAYAETPGPSKGKLTSRFAETARNLYGIYILITLVLIIILKILDMNWFDAVTTAFSTMATGGFANTNDNAGCFSIPVKVVLIFFMFLAGINFNLFYRAGKQGPKVIIKDQEVRFYTIIMLAGALLIFTCNVWYKTDYNAGMTLLDSMFHVVSINTTTGFTMGDYDSWPTFSRMVLFGFFFIGGCASSTGGGIKVSRIMICLKLVKRSFSLRLHPNRVGKITINNVGVDTDTAIKATGFVFTYILTVIVGTLLISLNDLGFMTSFSCAASCLGNIGPGFALIGPSYNYGALSLFSKFVCSILMIAGRLELYTLFVLFSPHYWNPNRSR
ncbi:MAG: TrkH family potassium uptake protein [Firmicutes bacterium]|nr:TrkH family potassium uptake protein [Bacillota bacterium]